MTKKELVQIVSKNTGISQVNVAVVIDATFAAIAKGVQRGDGFIIKGFGGFKQVQRKSRTGRNPQTGKPIKIKARKALKFSPAQAMRDL